MGSKPGDEPATPLLEVGKVDRPHGLAGEVVVSLVTNRTERLSAGSVLQARLLGAGAGFRELRVDSARPFQDRHLVVFGGVATREQADDLRGAVLLAPALDDPDALFVHDLVDSAVVEVDGTERGVVIAVEANPASDLLVLDDGALVPLRFVVRREPGRLVVDVPAGLFEP